MLNYVFTLFLALNFNTLTAQDSTVIYYDEDWEVQDWEIDAAYFRIQKIEPKTELITVTDYWISGEIQMTGSFMSNTKPVSKNGKFVWYNKDGSIDWEVSYQNGKKNGIETRWYGFDSLRATKHYMNGKLDGEYLRYYKNGDLMDQEFFKQGEANGTATTWYEGGVIESITKYNVSNIDSVYYWYENGDKLLEGTLFETEVEDLKFGNYWDSTRTQTVSNGNGFLVIDDDDDYYWMGQITNGLYNGVWSKYKLSTELDLIGKMKFKNGNFKKGYLDFRGGKVKLEGGWTLSPEFPNGHKGLSKYIGSALGGCRNEIIENTVYVEFVIKKNGKISEIKIVSGKTSKCQEENIYKMFDNMPIWTPGIHYGDFVRVRYTIPIKYTL